MVVRFIFSSILQIWYVEVWISRSISESPLDFEITRVNCTFLSMCKCQRKSHKLNIKLFGLYSVCELFVGVYTSIKSTKIKFIPTMLSVEIFIKHPKDLTVMTFWYLNHDGVFSVDGSITTVLFFNSYFKNLHFFSQTTDKGVFRFFFFFFAAKCCETH